MIEWRPLVMAIEANMMVVIFFMNCDWRTKKKLKFDDMYQVKIKMIRFQ